MDRQSQRAPLQGHSSEILRIVSKSATEEQWAEWLRVPLEHAARDGNLDLFNALLGAGTEAGVGWKGCGGRTLLQAAVRGGNVDIVSFMLMSGSQQDVNVLCPFSGRSTLLIAIFQANETLARRLVLAGADVNFAQANNNTVLHEAVDRGYGDLVNDLLLAGAHASARRTDSGKSETALHVAAKQGHASIVSALLLKGADKDEVDDQGNTPLTHATYNGHRLVVETLLAAGADLDTKVSIHGIAARSILNLAAELGHGAILKEVIRIRTGLDGDTSRCVTALPWAIFGDRPRTIDVLVEAGANVEMLLKNAATPLLYAAAGGHHNAIHALLRHGASANARNETGSTALHLVCSQKRWGCALVVAWLLWNGAEETARDNDLYTPAARLDSPTPRVAPQYSLVEVEVIRRMLAHAPADRMWRRRGWLAMLRSRAEKARSLEGYGGDGIGAHAHRETELPREERSDMGEEDTQEGNCSRMIVKGLAGAVNMLMERASKDVFRTTVSFL